MRLTFNLSGGWTDLESEYKTEKKPKELKAKNLKISNCNLGGDEISGLLKFYKTFEGLLITKSWLIKNGEDSLLIPWDEFIDWRARKVFFTKKVRLIIGNPFVSFIDIDEKDFEKIKDQMPIDENK